MKCNIKPHETTRPFMLRYKHTGWMGYGSKKDYPNESYLFQSLFKIEVFYTCLN